MNRFVSRVGRALRPDTPIDTRWFAICCLVAAPIVYVFEQQFYEAVTLTFLGGKHFLFRAMGPFARSCVDSIAPSKNVNSLGDLLGGLIYVVFIFIPLTLI